MSQIDLLTVKLTKRALFPWLCILLLLMPGDGTAAAFIDLDIAAVTYRIELARSNAERRQGLMQRQSLDRLNGLLLVYRRPGNHGIWMKNMLIPIRVYWIDSDFRVIDSKRLEPCLQAFCEVYSVSQPSLYVLELSDHDHDLKPGDRIEGLSGL